MHLAMENARALKQTDEYVEAETKAWIERLMIARADRSVDG